MTKGEFDAKAKGFLEYQKQQNENNQKLALFQAWHVGIFCSFSFGGMKDYPKLENILSSKPQSEETDEELIELAKEKGLEVPE